MNTESEFLKKYDDTRNKWEEEVINQIEVLGEMTYSDATALKGFEENLYEGWIMSWDARQTAEYILEDSKA